jgi:hypothetical protein
VKKRSTSPENKSQVMNSSLMDACCASGGKEWIMCSPKGKEVTKELPEKDVHCHYNPSYHCCHHRCDCD